MGCPALFRLLPTSAASASLRLLPIGPKRASGQGCDEWSGVRGVPAPKANEPSSPKLGSRRFGAEAAGRAVDGPSQ
jgi:hypothetical protein